jgi:very-short-patch-repair endonuclease
VTARIVWLGEHHATEESGTERWDALDSRASEIAQCDIAVLYCPVGTYPNVLALSELALATRLGKTTLFTEEDNPRQTNADFWINRASTHCIPHMTREQASSVASALTEHACGHAFNLPFPNELLAALAKAESPIEARLGMHLVRECDMQHFVAPQADLVTGGKKYRADFLVSSEHDGSGVRVVVEADGHDYHERTKEQAARDKKRDRLMVAEGIYVLRFTGSEIWKDAAACAKEVSDFVTAKAEEETIRLWEATHK